MHRLALRCPNALPVSSAPLPKMLVRDGNNHEPDRRRLVYSGALATVSPMLTMGVVAVAPIWCIVGLKQDNTGARREMTQDTPPRKRTKKGWWPIPHGHALDRKSTRLNSSHLGISYA